MTSLFGIKIVPHLLARDRRTEFKVARCGPPGKKRRRYFVQCIDIDRPGCWQIGGTLYMHPDLIAKLPRAA